MIAHVKYSPNVTILEEQATVLFYFHGIFEVKKQTLKFGAKKAPLKRIYYFHVTIKINLRAEFFRTLEQNFSCL